MLPLLPKRRIELKLKQGKVIKGFKIKESRTGKSYVVQVQWFPTIVEKSYLKKDIEVLFVDGELQDITVKTEKHQSNKKINTIKYNTDMQYYKGLPLRLIARKDYKTKRAKRYAINDTNQNVWIPNKFLSEDGTIKADADIMFVFKGAERKLELAGFKFKY